MTALTYDTLVSIIQGDLVKGSVLNSVVLRVPPSLEVQRACATDWDPPFRAPLPVLGRFETVLRHWLDHPWCTDVWLLAERAYRDATGHDDFVRFVLGSLARRPLMEEGRRRIATFCVMLLEHWLAASSGLALEPPIQDPLHMWRGLIGTLDVPELWDLLMLAYMLEEERSGYLSFHLTLEDSFEGGSTTSMFVNATRYFRDTFRTLQMLKGSEKNVEGM
jgi:hypothetical protein